jgi:hypothetical protein
MRSERAIQETLVQSKTLKQRDIMSHIVSDEATEKRMWRTTVLEDEFSKPMVVADSEIHNIQASDAAAKRKLEKVIMLFKFSFSTLFHSYYNSFRSLIK